MLTYRDVELCNVQRVTLVDRVCFPGSAFRLSLVASATQDPHLHELGPARASIYPNLHRVYDVRFDCLTPLLDSRLTSTAWNTLHALAALPWRT